MREASRTSRIFLAFCPPRPLRARLHRYQDACAWKRGAARVPPDKLHVTLYFIGDVARQRLAEIIPALEVPFEPFDLRLDTAELWAGGVSVLRTSHVPDALVRLREALHQRIAALALQPDARAVRPHLTLARNAAGMVWPERLPALAWPVDHYVLLESGHPATTPYQILQQYPTPSRTWHLYLIECADESLYAGISTDVAARYKAHCCGKGAKYTCAKPPVRLIGSRPCGTRSDALKAEFAIRKLGRAEKIAAIQAPVANK